MKLSSEAVVIADNLIVVPLLFAFLPRPSRLHFFTTLILFLQPLSFNLFQTFLPVVWDLEAVVQLGYPLLVYNCFILVILNKLSPLVALLILSICRLLRILSLRVWTLTVGHDYGISIPRSLRIVTIQDGFLCLLQLLLFLFKFLLGFLVDINSLSVANRMVLDYRREMKISKAKQQHPSYEDRHNVQVCGFLVLVGGVNFHHLIAYEETEDKGPEEVEGKNTHSGVYRPTILVHSGPNSEEPSRQIDYEDNVDYLNASCAFLIIVAKAAASTCHISVLVLFVLAAYFTKAFLLFLENSQRHSLDAPIFLCNFIKTAVTAILL